MGNTVNQPRDQVNDASTKTGFFTWGTGKDTRGKYNEICVKNLDRMFSRSAMTPEEYNAAVTQCSVDTGGFSTIVNNYTYGVKGAAQDLWWRASDTAYQARVAAVDTPIKAVATSVKKALKTVGGAVGDGAKDALVYVAIIGVASAVAWFFFKKRVG